MGTFNNYIPQQVSQTTTVLDEFGLDSCGFFSLNEYLEITHAASHERQTHNFAKPYAVEPTPHLPAFDTQELSATNAMLYALPTNTTYVDLIERTNYLLSDAQKDAFISQMADGILANSDMFQQFLQHAGTIPALCDAIQSKLPTHAPSENAL